MACCFAGRGSPTHLNPLGRQVFDMGSSERDECMNEIRLLQQIPATYLQQQRASIRKKSLGASLGR